MLKLQHKNVVRYYNCWFELKDNTIKKKIPRTKSKQMINVTRSSVAKASDVEDPSIKTDNLGLEFIEKDEKSKIVEEEEPQEIFSNSSEEEKAKSISYEKVVSKEEKSKIISADKSIIDKNEKKAKGGNGFISILFYMQMEFCGGSTLQEYLDKRIEALDRKKIFSLFKQIAYGVYHIHKNNIIHRDLKPSNIFMIGDYLKIGDFGLAAEVNESSHSKSTQINKNLTIDKHNEMNLGKTLNDTTKGLIDSSVKLMENVGTPLYQSPEQINNILYNEKVDIYAMGLILIEICSQFKTYHEKKVCFENMRNNGTIPQKLKDDYPLESSLILMMTKLKPNLRPSAKGLTETEEFQKFKE